MINEEEHTIRNPPNCNIYLSKDESHNSQFLKYRALHAIYT